LLSHSIFIKGVWRQEGHGSATSLSPSPSPTERLAKRSPALPARSDPPQLQRKFARSYYKKQPQLRQASAISGSSPTVHNQQRQRYSARRSFHRTSGWGQI